MLLVVIAALTGTITLRLAQMAQHHHRPWRREEQAAAIAGTGILAATVTTLDGGYGLVPFAVLGGAAAVVDSVELRLPDLLTGSLAVATALLVAVDGLISRSADGIVRTVMTVGGVCAVALLAKLIRTSLLGWGDVKFMISLAGVLGWRSETAILTGVVLWAALIVITSAVVAALQPGRYTAVPYGPALLLGTLGALAAGG